MSRLLKFIGLFCRILCLLQGFFAKETYVFREPTNRSHPICLFAGNDISVNADALLGLGGLGTPKV